MVRVIRKVVPRVRKAMKADRGRGSIERRDIDVSEYRNGAEGMIKWVEDRCWGEIVPISTNLEAIGDVKTWVPMRELPDTLHPETGKSYKMIWEEQKKILRKALVMEHGRFKYTVVILCWMRGEGKSFLACLIQLWKFFCWPRQQIMLGANSKEQTKFVHFDIMREIIKHSPELFSQVGGRNIQEKEIRITNKEGNVDSLIRSISSFTGIFSNITGYTFSEMFDMKNPKFFVQLDGSIRNVPNALGVIDSTVSAKDHVLYQLYLKSVAGEIKTLFYSYRHSKLGDIVDYWHPNMTHNQLMDYNAKFPFGEFERYFLNLWSAGTSRVFTEEMVEAMSFYGIDEGVLNNSIIFKALLEKNTLISARNDLIEKGLSADVDGMNAKVVGIYERLKKIDEVYVLGNSFGATVMATIDSLTKLEELFDTHFALLGSVDRADPTAIRSQAKTIVSVTAKGLPGSRSNPHIVNLLEAAPRYIYFLLLLAELKSDSIEEMKEALELCDQEFDGIDTFCSERYGAWDMEPWCVDRDIKFELVYPNYGRQREAFNEFYNIVKAGLFKAPEVPVRGMKKDNLFTEEMAVFDHDVDAKWFGSPEKSEKYGIQDDSIYAVGWGIYGGRELTVDDFRLRKSMVSFGVFTPDKTMIGKYK